MNRPSVALTIICKNEVKNLPVLLSSVRDCFDKIYITDTGSTDGTVELLKSYQENIELNPANTPIELLYFKWIQDFGAARNYALDKIKEDYWFWIDCDDVLQNPENFRHWRDTTLITADMWLARYIYASDAAGNPTCVFARERCMRTDLNLRFQDFLHEGVKPITAEGRVPASNYATTWAIVHKRSDVDLKADKGRNLAIFENKEASGVTLSPRMLFYYGKELFEADKPLEAYQKLLQATTQKDLELHDRILGIQYAALACMKLNQYEKAISLAHQGMQLSPQRAEFHVIVGDCYIKLNQIQHSIPYYNAARKCINPESSANGLIAGALFTQADMYSSYPTAQLSRSYLHTGQPEKAKELLEEFLKTHQSDECSGLLVEVNKMCELARIPTHSTRAKEIVISCPGNGPYEWDEGLEKTVGMGGSEIAAIRMARALHRKTGYRVRIFNNVKEVREFDGVIYEPSNTINHYMHKQEPSVHIAWRHNIKVTNAPTYLWCHDLYCQNIEKHQNYEKVLSLSAFHKSYIRGLFPIPEDKILVTRNGIDSSMFQKATKNPLKVVFCSSPDRGLMNAIEVVDRARDSLGVPLELHFFYGFDNMVKYGRGADVDKMLAVVNSKPWVVNHGNLQHEQFAKAISDAVMWVYPTVFLETFCKVALETALSGVYPIFRDYGAVPNTLSRFVERGQATKIHADAPVTAYVKAIEDAYKEKKWEIVDTSEEEREHHSWDTVADEWLKFLKL